MLDMDCAYGMSLSFMFCICFGNIKIHIIYRHWSIYFFVEYKDRFILYRQCHGPLTSYVKLRVVHAPVMPGTFSRHRGLAIPTCITARAWSTYRDACRVRWLKVFIEVGDGENVPGIPGACATRIFTYLIRSPWLLMSWQCKATSGQRTE